MGKEKKVDKIKTDKINKWKKAISEILGRPRYDFGDGEGLKRLHQSAISDGEGEYFREALVAILNSKDEKLPLYIVGWLVTYQIWSEEIEKAVRRFVRFCPPDLLKDVKRYLGEA